MDNKKKIGIVTFFSFAVLAAPVYLRAENAATDYPPPASSSTSDYNNNDSYNYQATTYKPASSTLVTYPDSQIVETQPVPQTKPAAPPVSAVPDRPERTVLQETTPAAETTTAAVPAAKARYVGTTSGPVIAENHAAVVKTEPDGTTVTTIHHDNPGVISSAWHLIGKVLALPFKLVGAVIEFVF